MEKKIAHLNIVQGVINRMARNSFHLKGWSVVLVSALFALASKDLHLAFVYLAYFPAIVFWGLDSYFLRQERLFRRLYDHVRSLPDAEIDFSMSTRPFEKDIDSWASVTTSKTLLPFHGVILFAIALVTVISLYVNTGGTLNGS